MRSLRNLLPFGCHLTRSDLDTFVNHTLDHVVVGALQQLYYWQLAGTTNSFHELIEHIILTEDETQLWLQYIPANHRIIQDLLYNGQHVFYLSRFYLTHDHIEIGFNEVRIITGPLAGQPRNVPISAFPPRFVITDGREYSYWWNTRIWTNSLRNPDQCIIDPLTFIHPPLAPQSLAFAYRNRTPPIQTTLPTLQTVLDPEALANARDELAEVLPVTEEPLPPSSPTKTTTSGSQYPKNLGTRTTTVAFAKRKSVTAVIGQIPPRCLQVSTCGDPTTTRSHPHLQHRRLLARHTVLHISSVISWNHRASFRSGYQD